MYLVNQPFIEKKENAKSRHQIELEEIPELKKNYEQEIHFRLQLNPEVPDNYYLWLVPSLAAKSLGALQELPR